MYNGGYFDHISAEVTLAAALCDTTSMLLQLTPGVVLLDPIIIGEPL